MIRILKASAGSGKTYNLALTYIKLLLCGADKYSYRHILAVTFTNKATSEMKTRILRELSLIAADPVSSPYYSELVPSVCSSPAELQKRASELLPAILHDYSAFAVSTIDTFFQRTLKAFAREIGYYASYQVELDRESLIGETVDRMLDSLTEDDRDLLQWMTASVGEKLEQGQGVHVEDALTDMGLKLKATEFTTLSRHCGMDPLKAYSKENVRSIRRACRETIKAFNTSLAAAATAALKALEQLSLSVEDSSRGSLKPLLEWSRLSPDAKTVKTATQPFLDACRDPQRFFKKADWARYGPSLQGAFSDALGALADVFERGSLPRNTASVVLEGTFSLGVAREFLSGFDALVAEKNIMSLDDANTILKRIIDGSDAPFIYEKTGVRYEHFLLDEFQDTSSVQWDNFRPLLSESDAYGRENLVVGDIKQSIYRWRGSDWHLLADSIKEDFPQAAERSLQHNFRSLRSVVEFNNSFFTALAGWLDDKLELSGHGSISDIYRDVHQECGTRDKAEGYVRLDFVPAEEESLAVVEAIAAARAAGAAYRDIAVLVRSHKVGATIAQALITEGIPVISDDSLLVKSSVTVRRLVSLLSCVDNPRDEVSGYLAALTGLEYPSGYHSLCDLCESLLRTLRDYDSSSFEGEVLYIQTFMDVVQDWAMVNGNNLAAFLKYWKEADPKIISPEDSDSVTIMTIHKSKGLQFPYVIIPMAEGIGARHPQNVHWCLPELPEGVLPELDNTLFSINVSGSLKKTYFSGSFAEEQVSMAVDNINLAYVAFTRAEKVLHVISAQPEDSVCEALRRADVSKCSNLSHYLYLYKLSGGDEFGSMYDFAKMDRSRSEQPARAFETLYPSIPLIIGDDASADNVGERSRLKFSTDAADFFGADGSVSMHASPRLGGIVRHNILSRIDSVSSLRASVDIAVRAGELTAEEGQRVYEDLKSKIAAGVSRGWFDAGELSRNEVSLIDSDGSVLRPDRVVIKDGCVDVIDYKFGDPHDSYPWQVRRYMRLYRQMGYKHVRGWLWYLRDGDIVSVSPVSGNGGK